MAKPKKEVKTRKPKDYSRYYEAARDTSEHYFPAVTNTISNFNKTIRDVDNWVKTSTPFKKAPQGTAGEKKIFSVAEGILRAAGTDIKEGNILSFKNLNEKINDLFNGMGEKSFDDSYDAEYDDGNAYEDSASYDGFDSELYVQGTAISTQATIDAVSTATESITGAQLRASDYSSRRIVAGTNIAISRVLKFQAMNADIMNTINQNMGTLVESANKQDTFQQQALSFYERTENYFNDILEVMREQADPAAARKAENAKYRSRERKGNRFLENGFDPGAFVKGIWDDSMLGFMGKMLMGTIAPYAAFLGFDLSKLAEGGLGGMGGFEGIRPVRMLFEKTPLAKQLHKLNDDFEDNLKLLFHRLGQGEFGGILGEISNLGLLGDYKLGKSGGIDLSNYDKGVTKITGKTLKTIETVVPTYLSNIENDIATLVEGFTTGQFEIGTFQSKKRRTAAEREANVQYFEEMRSRKHRNVYDLNEGKFRNLDEFEHDFQEDYNQVFSSAFGPVMDKVSLILSAHSEEEKKAVNDILNQLFEEYGNDTKIRASKGARDNFINTLKFIGVDRSKFADDKAMETALEDIYNQFILAQDRFQQARADFFESAVSDSNVYENLFNTSKDKWKDADSFKAKKDIQRATTLNYREVKGANSRSWGGKEYKYEFTKDYRERIKDKEDSLDWRSTGDNASVDRQQYEDYKNLMTLYDDYKDPQNSPEDLKAKKKAYKKAAWKYKNTWKEEAPQLNDYDEWLGHYATDDKMSFMFGLWQPEIASGHEVTRANHAMQKVVWGGNVDENVSGYYDDDRHKNYMDLYREAIAGVTPTGTNPTASSSSQPLSANDQSQSSGDSSGGTSATSDTGGTVGAAPQQTPASANVSEEQAQAQGTSQSGAGVTQGATNQSQGQTSDNNTQSDTDTTTRRRPRFTISRPSTSGTAPVNDISSATPSDEGQPEVGSDSATPPESQDSTIATPITAGTAANSPDAPAREVRVKGASDIGQYMKAFMNDKVKGAKTWMTQKKEVLMELLSNSRILAGNAENQRIRLFGAGGIFDRMRGFIDKFNVVKKFLLGEKDPKTGYYSGGLIPPEYANKLVDAKKAAKNYIHGTEYTDYHGEFHAAKEDYLLKPVEEATYEMHKNMLISKYGEDFEHNKDYQNSWNFIKIRDSAHKELHLPRAWSGAIDENNVAIDTYDYSKFNPTPHSKAKLLGWVWNSNNYIWEFHYIYNDEEKVQLPTDEWKQSCVLSNVLPDVVPTEIVINIINRLPSPSEAEANKITENLKAGPVRAKGLSVKDIDSRHLTEEAFEARHGESLRSYDSQHLTEQEFKDKYGISVQEFSNASSAETPTSSAQAPNGVPAENAAPAEGGDAAQEPAPAAALTEDEIETISSDDFNAIITGLEDLTEQIAEQNDGDEPASVTDEQFGSYEEMVEYSFSAILDRLDTIVSKMYGGADPESILGTTRTSPTREAPESTPDLGTTRSSTGRVVSFDINGDEIDNNISETENETSDKADSDRVNLGDVEVQDVQDSTPQEQPRRNDGQQPEGVAENAHQTSDRVNLGDVEVQDVQDSTPQEQPRRNDGQQSRTNQAPRQSSTPSDTTTSETPIPESEPIQNEGRTEESEDNQSQPGKKKKRKNIKFFSRTKATADTADQSETAGNPNTQYLPDDFDANEYDSNSTNYFYHRGKRAVRKTYSSSKDYKSRNFAYYQNDDGSLGNYIGEDVAADLSSPNYQGEYTNEHPRPIAQQYLPDDFDAPLYSDESTSYFYHQGRKAVRKTYTSHQGPNQSTSRNFSYYQNDDGSLGEYIGEDTEADLRSPDYHDMQVEALNNEEAEEHPHLKRFARGIGKAGMLFMGPKPMKRIASIAIGAALGGGPVGALAGFLMSTAGEKIMQKSESEGKKFFNFGGGKKSIFGSLSNPNSKFPLLSGIGGFIKGIPNLLMTIGGTVAGLLLGGPVGGVVGFTLGHSTFRQGGLHDILFGSGKKNQNKFSLPKLFGTTVKGIFGVGKAAAGGILKGFMGARKTLNDNTKDAGNLVPLVGTLLGMGIGGVPGALIGRAGGKILGQLGHSIFGGNQENVGNGEGEPITTTGYPVPQDETPIQEKPQVEVQPKPINIPQLKEQPEEPENSYEFVGKGIDDNPYDPERGIEAVEDQTVDIVAAIDSGIDRVVDHMDYMDTVGVRRKEKEAHDERERQETLWAQGANEDEEEPIVAASADYDAEKEPEKKTSIFDTLKNLFSGGGLLDILKVALPVGGAVWLLSSFFKTDVGQDLKNKLSSVFTGIGNILDGAQSLLEGIATGADAITNKGIGLGRFGTFKTNISNKNPDGTAKNNFVDDMLGFETESYIDEETGEVVTNKEWHPTHISGDVTKAVITGGAQKVVWDLIESFTKSFPECLKKAPGKLKKWGIEKATAGLEKFFAKQVSKGNTKLVEFIAKNATRLEAQLTESGLKFISVEGRIAFAVWGAGSGAMWGTAELFGVDEGNSDVKMRVIAGALGALCWGTTIGSAADFVSAILREALGIDLKKALATTIYDAISDPADSNKLKDNQADFQNRMSMLNNQLDSIGADTLSESEFHDETNKTWWDYEVEGLRKSANGIINTVINSNPIGLVHQLATGETWDVDVGWETKHSKEVEATRNMLNAQEVAAMQKESQYQNMSVENITAQDNEGYGTGRSVGYGYSDSTHYSQLDSTWKNLTFGKMLNGRSTTIGSGGCGPTALATVARSITGNKRITPSTVANMAQDYGYTANGGSAASLFTEGASRLGLASQRVSTSDVPSALASGQKLIISGKKSGGGKSLYTNAGHIVSVNGIKNGKAIVDDPLKSKTETMDIRDVMKGAKKAWAIGTPGSSVGYGTIDDYISNMESMGYGFDENGKLIDFVSNADKYQPWRDGKSFGDIVSATGGEDDLGVFFQQGSWGSGYSADSAKSWASMKFGSDTYQDSGCFPTAFASALSNVTRTDIDPPLVIKKFGSNWSGSAYNWTAYNDMLNLLYGQAGATAVEDQLLDTGFTDTHRDRGTPWRPAGYNSLSNDEQINEAMKRVTKTLMGGGSVWIDAYGSQNNTNVFTTPHTGGHAISMYGYERGEGQEPGTLYDNYEGSAITTEFDPGRSMSSGAAVRKFSLSKLRADINNGRIRRITTFPKPPKSAAQLAGEVQDAMADFASGYSVRSGSGGSIVGGAAADSAGGVSVSGSSSSSSAPMDVAPESTGSLANDYGGYMYADQLSDDKSFFGKLGNFMSILGGIASNIWNSIGGEKYQSVFGHYTSGGSGVGSYQNDLDTVAGVSHTPRYITVKHNYLKEGAFLDIGDLDMSNDETLTSVAEDVSKYFIERWREKNPALPSYDEDHERWAPTLQFYKDEILKAWKNQEFVDGRYYKITGPSGDPILVPAWYSKENAINYMKEQQPLEDVADRIKKFHPNLTTDEEVAEYYDKVMNEAYNKDAEGRNSNGGSHGVELYDIAGSHYNQSQVNDGTVTIGGEVIEGMDTNSDDDNEFAENNKIIDVGMGELKGTGRDLRFLTVDDKDYDSSKLINGLTREQLQNAPIITPTLLRGYSSGSYASDAASAGMDWDVKVPNGNPLEYAQTGYKMDIVPDGSYDYIDDPGVGFAGDTAKSKLSNAYGPVSIPEGWSSVEKISADRFDPGIDKHTLFRDVRKFPPINATKMNELISNITSSSVYQGQGQTFIDASNISGIDPRFLLVQSGIESGWGSSKLAKNKGNYFGITAYDGSAYSSGTNFAKDGKADFRTGILNGSQWISRNHINRTSKWIPKAAPALLGWDDGHIYGVGDSANGVPRRTAYGQGIAKILKKTEGYGDTTEFESEGYGNPFMNAISNYDDSADLTQNASFNRILGIPTSEGYGTLNTSNYNQNRSSMNISTTRHYAPNFKSDDHSKIEVEANVDLGRLENGTLKMVSLLQKIADNTKEAARNKGASHTTINNIRETTNNTGYGRVDMVSKEEKQKVQAGVSRQKVNNTQVDKMRQLHNIIAKSPRAQ